MVRSPIFGYSTGENAAVSTFNPLLAGAVPDDAEEYADAALAAGSTEDLSAETTEVSPAVTAPVLTGEEETAGTLHMVLFIYARLWV